MIGFISSDCGTMIEIWPIFGGESGIPSFSQFRTKKVLPEKLWGEFGIGFNGLTLYVMWSISTYPVDFGTFRGQLRRIMRDIRQWWRES